MRPTVVLVAALVSGLVGASLQINMDFQTVEDSCTMSMTSGNAYADVNVGLLRYKQQCRNMDEFISCVITTRRFNDLINIDLPSYDKYFPAEEDLRYAGYIFCKSYLPSLLKLFPPEVDMGACKPNTESCRAEHVKASDVEMLRTAVKAKDIPRSRIYSCRILAPFTNCIRIGLIECNPNYEKLLDYELAKFGGVCLASMNIQSPLVALGKCHSQYSNWMQRASARSLVWTWCSLLASTLISFLGSGAVLGDIP